MARSTLGGARSGRGEVEGGVAKGRRWLKVSPSLVMLVGALSVVVGATLVGTGIALASGLTLAMSTTGSGVRCNHSNDEAPYCTKLVDDDVLTLDGVGFSPGATASAIEFNNDPSQPVQPLLGQDIPISSSNLAFTGTGSGVKVIAVVGAVLVVLGLLLLIVADVPRRILRSLAFAPSRLRSRRAGRAPTRPRVRLPQRPSFRLPSFSHIRLPWSHSMRAPSTTAEEVSNPAPEARPVRPLPDTVGHSMVTRSPSPQKPRRSIMKSAQLSAWWLLGRD